MTVRNLDKAFSPKSVALIGASERPGSVGEVMTRNLLEGGFPGSIWLVNPKYTAIRGATCYPGVEFLPAAPDLAIIATPPETIPGLITSLGEKGTRAAVVITAAIREQGLQQAMLDAAKPYCLRIIGPNCLGLLAPAEGLNASFAHLKPEAGGLAFISQSGALIGAVLDWAAARGIGFSSMVSMGDMADVDVGDLLDYLAADRKTNAILMYLEQVTNARKFMSAARSAARVKPVIVIKAGRHEAAAKAAKSHTGALAGSDQVYNAAFRRAGLVRVSELEDLFDAAETLCRTRLSSGDKLAIVTNGGGAGVLAIDSLLDCGGTPAVLSPETLRKLDAVLPSNWSKDNPVDIIGDADAHRYEAALQAVLEDKGVDAVLVMNCPTALASNQATAAATIRTAAGSGKVVLTSWLGDKTAREARAAFDAAGIPTYETPDDAIRAFTFLTSHYKAQAALLRTPPALPEKAVADRARAKQAIQEALLKKREFLSEWEIKTVLSAYGIPVVPASTVRSWDLVGDAVTNMMTGSSVREVVVKVMSPDITHKSDVGGVALGLPDAAAAQKAAQEMFERLKKTHVRAHIDGFSIQPMIRRGNARELILGVSEDPTFGPVILFGAGGTAVEVIRDRAIGLPPLDMHLARDLIEQTEAYKTLKAYRNLPAANLDAIALALVNLAQMIVELPEIRELDINPLLADEKGVLALDARIIVRPVPASRDGLNARCVIRPYPQQWEAQEKLPGGRTIVMRPIRPNDERLYDQFLEKTTDDDLRLRLFSSWRDLSHEFLARMTQIDYARAMAFVAIDAENGELLGVSRMMADPDYQRAEFAVIVRSDLQRQGIGYALMRRLIDYARSEDIGELWAHILQENGAMIHMCGELGFRISPTDGEKAVLQASLDLRQPAGANARAAAS